MRNKVTSAFLAYSIECAESIQFDSLTGDDNETPVVLTYEADFTFALAPAETIRNRGVLFKDQYNTLK